MTQPATPPDPASAQDAPVDLNIVVADLYTQVGQLAGMLSMRQAALQGAYTQIGQLRARVTELEGRLAEALAADVPAPVFPAEAPLPHPGGAGSTPD